MDACGEGPSRKRACTGSEKVMGSPQTTYAERVQNGGITEELKAFLFQEMAQDLGKLSSRVSEGKRVLHATTELSTGKAFSGLHKAMACGLYLYFMGKPPSEEFRRWFTEIYGSKVSLSKFHFAGKGFYQATVETEAQRDYVLSTVAAFKGDIVYTVPWAPAIKLAEMLQFHCPVWVAFPDLPYYLWDQVRDMASALRNVLHTPKEGQQESKAAKRACIMWDRRRETPDFMQFNLAGLKVDIEVRFQAFPDSCYKCRA